MLGLLDLEIIGHEPHRCSGPPVLLVGGAADEGVADRALEIEAERITELIALARRRPLVAEARSHRLMLADLILGQTLEHVAERVRADLADAARRQPQSGLGVLDQAGFSQPAGEFGQPLQRPHRVVTEQLADTFRVEFGERVRRRDAT